jgi:hypothetical protein
MRIRHGFNDRREGDARRTFSKHDSIFFRVVCGKLATPGRLMTNWIPNLVSLNTLKKGSNSFPKKLNDYRTIVS